MSASDQFINSLKYTLKGFSIIATLKLRWIYLLPFLVYVIIYSTGFTLTNELHGQLMSYVEELTSSWAEGSSFFSFLFTASSVLTWLIIKVALFLIFGIISGYLTLIILSPIYAWISEKTEEKLKGQHYPFRIQKFIKDVIRAIMIAVRNGAIQLIWTALLFILSFVPLLNLITAPALFVITAYFYGFSFLDYCNERLGLTMTESIRRVRKLKIASVTLGSVFLFAYMIPWIGPIIASMASFNLVVAGTQISLEFRLKE